MQTLQKAGGLVVNDKNEILIITNQIGKTTLPKGGQETGETLEQTATREVLEEGGLTEVRLVKKLGVIERPGYTAENFNTPSVIKQIHMFLFQADNDVLCPEVTDVEVAQWMTVDNALEVLSWKEEKDFLEQKRHEVS